MCSLYLPASQTAYAAAARPFLPPTRPPRRPRQQQQAARQQDNAVLPARLEQQRRQPSAASSTVQDGDSSAGGLPLPPLAVTGLAASIALAPLLLPLTASAASVLATLVPHTLQHQHHQNWETVYWGCVAVGAASTLVTLVCTSRFLVSL